MAISVAELIKQLQTMPQDAMVVLASDGEGNGYSPLSDVYSGAVYAADTPLSGEVFETGWSAVDADFDSDEEWEEFKRTKPQCCVLKPVN